MPIESFGLDPKAQLTQALDADHGQACSCALIQPSRDRVFWQRGASTHAFEPLDRQDEAFA